MDINMQPPFEGGTNYPSFQYIAENPEIRSQNYRHNDHVPALWLPTEVACTIFKLAASPPPTFDADDSDCVSSLYYRTEVNVSQVCVLWRSMALTYPDLWSTFAHDDVWGEKISWQWLSTYMKRSRNSLVDLYIRMDNQQRDDWLDALDCILSHVARLRRLSLRIDREWPMGYLFSEIARHEAPNLEVLELCCRADLVNTSIRRAFFKHATPRLRFLRLDAESFAITAPRRWDNMTTVAIHIDSQSEFVHSGNTAWSMFTALLQCRTLTYLTLEGGIFYRPLIGELSKPTLAPNLKYFRCSEPVVFIYMWQLVRAPKLELLVLMNVHISDARLSLDDDTVDMLDSGIYPSLSTLVLINCSLNRPEESYIFSRATASTTKVVLIHPRLDMGFLHVMVEEAGSIPQVTLLWPKVDSIVVIFYDESGEDGHYIAPRNRADNPAKLLEMVERRSAYLKRPCKLGIHTNHAVRWEAKSSRNYARFKRSGLILGIYTDEDYGQIIPWPLQDSGVFDPSSETPFFHSGC